MLLIADHAVKGWLRIVERAFASVQTVGIGYLATKPAKQPPEQTGSRGNRKGIDGKLRNNSAFPARVTLCVCRLPAPRCLVERGIGGRFWYVDFILQISYLIFLYFILMITYHFVILIS